MMMRVIADARTRDAAPLSKRKSFYCSNGAEDYGSNKRDHPKRPMVPTQLSKSLPWHTCLRHGGRPF
jgi:hypothetical protein